MKDPENPKRWVIDEEAAAIVRRIYQMFLDGTGLEQIATLLEKNQILTPTAHAKKHGQKTTVKLTQNGPYAWKHSTVQKILGLREYCGGLINFKKTYSKSYKNKRRLKNAEENMMVFKDVHDPIIVREIWQRVQKRYGKTRQKQHTKSDDKFLWLYYYLLVSNKYSDNMVFATRRIENH